MHFSCLHEHELHSVVFCVCFCLSFSHSVGKALLEISQPLQFSETVQPICISTPSKNQNKTYDDKAAIISGWGNLNEEFTISKRFS